MVIYHRLEGCPPMSDDSTSGSNRWPAASGARVGPESSLDLVRQARDGDREALERLYARHRESLRAWAEGRLPPAARGHVDVEAVLRDSLALALRGEEVLQAGTFWEALRQRILEKMSTLSHASSPEASGPGGPEATSEAEAVGGSNLARYDRALSRLEPLQRHALVMRTEMGCSYEDVARFLGKSSIGAARMAVCRALVRLGIEMSREASSASS